MARYSVGLKSPGSIKLHDNLGLQFEDPAGRSGSLVCGNWTEPTGDGHPAHRGLVIQVELSADSMEDAVIGATNAAEATLTALVLQSLGSSARPQLDIVYDSTPEISERELWQDFEVSMASRPVKVARNEKAIEILDRIQRIRKQSRRQRVIRAGMSLRRGLDIADPLSRFNEYWTGLECLNPILETKLETETAYWTCDCGKRHRKEEARGVKAFVIEINGAEFFRTVRSLRRDIFHGVGTFSDVQVGAKDAAPVLEKTLHKATLFCLGESLAEANSLEIRSLHGYAKPAMRLRAILAESDPTKLGEPAEAHPHFELRSELLGTVQTGDLTQERVKHKFRANIACPYRVASITTVTPPGFTVTPVSASLTSEAGEQIDIEIDSTGESLREGGEA